jgi:hypothetical protein
MNEVLQMFRELSDGGCRENGSGRGTKMRGKTKLRRWTKSMGANFGLAHVCVCRKLFQDTYIRATETIRAMTRIIHDRYTNWILGMANL